MTVALAGDCMATRGSLITAEPRSHALRDLLWDADFAVANLEVVPTAGAGFPAGSPLDGGCLIADATVLDHIRALGFTVLGCANNHAMDMGVPGVLGAMELLRDRRIPFAGIGGNLTEARMPGYADGPRGSLALVSCTATFTSGDEACEASARLPGRPGLNPLRHRMTLRVTPQQLEVLNDIDRGTGLQAMRAETIALLGLDPARAVPGCLSLLGGLFQVSAEPGVETRCDPGDLAGITAWVAEARQRADAVIVSVHAHEPGLSPEEPAAFLRAFAHCAIDSGADAVLGHGPHFLRGVEVYRGKPIFYSLGNIVSQIELGELIPAEDYARVPPADRASPGRYFAARGGNGTALFGQHRKYWESVVPVLTFDDGELRSAVLYPVDLGFGNPVHRRGRPRIADRQLGAEILDHLARMSKPYGTRLEIAEQEDTHVQVIDL